MGISSKFTHKNNACGFGGRHNFDHLEYGYFEYGCFEYDDPEYGYSVNFFAAGVLD